MSVKVDFSGIVQWILPREWTHMDKKVPSM